MRHIRGKSDLKQKLNFKLELDSPAERGLLTPQLPVISGYAAVTPHTVATPGVHLGCVKYRTKSQSPRQPAKWCCDAW